MQRIRIITVFSALLIVLLHSFIPHKHHSEFSFTEHESVHQEASNIIDFLSLAFHVDHGEKHLEEFTVAGADVHSIDTEFQIPVAFDQSFISGTPVFNEKQVGFTSEPSVSNLLLTCEHSLRGPPSLS